MPLTWHSSNERDPCGPRPPGRWARTHIAPRPCTAAALLAALLHRVPGRGVTAGPAWPPHGCSLRPGCQLTSAGAGSAACSTPTGVRLLEAHQGAVHTLDDQRMLLESDRGLLVISSGGWRLGRDKRRHECHACVVWRVRLCYR